MVMKYSFSQKIPYVKEVLMNSIAELTVAIQREKSLPAAVNTTGMSKAEIRTALEGLRDNAFIEDSQNQIGILQMDLENLDKSLKEGKLVGISEQAFNEYYDMLPNIPELD